MAKYMPEPVKSMKIYGTTLGNLPLQLISFKSEADSLLVYP